MASIVKGIIFPSGMKHIKIDGDKIIMIQDPRLKESDPAYTTIDELRIFLKGLPMSDNNGFITGNDLIETIKENTTSLHPELQSQIAVFDTDGNLEGGGNYNDFLKTFLSNLPTELQ